MEAKTYLEAGRLTEEEAREYLEAIRWPNGPVCPRQGCGAMDATKLQGKSTRPGVYKCKACRKPFTVTVGGIFEDSHIPLSKWVLAFHKMCSSKKGISALQLQRDLGLGSYKSAWHMAHRIRHAMRQEPLASMLKLSGTLEMDETYVGGKPRFRGPQNKGRYRDHKTAVVALVQRGGEVRARAMEHVTLANLRSMLDQHADRDSRFMTDEAMHYRKLGREFKGGHGTTMHSWHQYLAGDTHSNTAESFFAILKRSVHGTHHHWSKQHLGRYVDERAFMWNSRVLDDGARAMLAMQGAEGKRLMYRETKAV